MLWLDGGKDHGGKPSSHLELTASDATSWPKFGVWATALTLRLGSKQCNEQTYN